MQKLSTHTHGIMDYAMGGALLFAPELFGFRNGGAASMVPRVMGLAMIKQSLLTDYELGAMKVIPMKAHLAMDMVAGGLLAASPWLFGFSHRPRNEWMPHVIAGATEVATALMTQSQPSYGSSSNLPVRWDDTPAMVGV
jgi:hypothetical protein